MPPARPDSASPCSPRPTVFSMHPPRPARPFARPPPASTLPHRSALAIRQRFRTRLRPTRASPHPHASTLCSRSPVNFHECTVASTYRHHPSHPTRQRQRATMSRLGSAGATPFRSYVKFEPERSTVPPAHTSGTPEISGNAKPRPLARGGTCETSGTVQSIRSATAAGCFNFADKTVLPPAEAPFVANTSPSA